MSLNILLFVCCCLFVCLFVSLLLLFFLFFFVFLCFLFFGGFFYEDIFIAGTVCVDLTRYITRHSSVIQIALSSSRRN